MRRFFSSRRGMALPMALIIVLFGSILVTGSFGFAVSSKKLATVRSKHYADQVLAFNYIEKTKGALLHKMLSGNKAIHPSVHPSLGASWENAPISTVDDLLIKEPGFYADVIEGNRRVLLEVFDLTYETDQLERAIVDDPSSLRRLPPMLKLTSSQMGVGNSMTNVGKTSSVLNEDKPKKDNAANPRADLEYFGAYLIRVQLFKLPYSAGDKPIRVTEEAFFQALNPNGAP